VAAGFRCADRDAFGFTRTLRDRCECLLNVGEGAFDGTEVARY
jgi:hypothetical protein